MPAISEPKKYGYIDALRGIAVLGVLLVHGGSAGVKQLSLITFISSGARGVQLFFVMSAFTLFLSLAKRSQEEGATRNYAIRRFFRIAPLYYVAIIVYFFELRHYGHSTNLANILFHLTFLHSLSPYYINTLVPGGWSIATEVLFYCLLPFLFIKIRSLYASIRFFFFSLYLTVVLDHFASVLNPIANHQVWTTFIYQSLPSQISVFALGIVLYYLVVGGKLNQIQAARVALVSFLTLMIQLTTSYLLFPDSVTYALGFVVLAYSLSLYPHPIFVNPVTKWIGKISYSMYLVHFIVLDWLSPRVSAVGPLMIGVHYLVLVVLTATISFFTWRFIEVPGQALGLWIIKQFQRPAKGVPSFVEPSLLNR